MPPPEFEPPEELRDIIKCFWYSSQDFGDQPASFEVIPDGYAEIIFHFGSLGSPSVQGGWQPLLSPFLVGLLNQPVVFHAKNRLEIIGIRCFPWAVFEVLGLPAGKDGARHGADPGAEVQASGGLHGERRVRADAL